ncbi:SMC-Scp complex subunit ScpB [Catenulispora pinisilvae]|uniref:SMC-Scp complex subunit ScpB n=1 Tax=Catenulispora pinisilvae TaxID=2705253 RepID=UPI00189254D8|nr:SMC-Scp complex subunit ScpB [Catenulispora pinisilvae]
MSDDWEYESPEYVAPDEDEAAAEVPAAQASAARDDSAEPEPEPEPAAVADLATESVAESAAAVEQAADSDRAAGSASAEPAVSASAAASAGLPAPRSEAKSPLPSPRTEAEPGVREPVEPTGPTEPTVEGFDDATWQLSTDMAPLPPLRQCLEAILLVVEEPVADVVLAQITERPRDEVVQTLQELAAEYTEQQRGFDLRQVAGGWRLYTRAACAPLVERFVLDGQQAKLSQPALETLAVVAYRQPVSRSRISAVRGVNCDGVMRTLLTRGLIEEAGTDADSGAILYRTTPLFLEKMGMRSLEELPELAPLLPSVESMEESETLA